LTTVASEVEKSKYARAVARVWLLPLTTNVTEAPVDREMIADLFAQRLAGDGRLRWPGHGGTERLVLDIIEPQGVGAFFGPFGEMDKASRR